MNFGQRLKYLREQKGFTQLDVAKFLGVGRATIAGYETKGKQPDYEKLELIADLFNVSIDYLLGRSDNLSHNVPIYDSRISKLPSDKKRILDTVLNELERTDSERSAVGG